MRTIAISFLAIFLLACGGGTTPSNTNNTHMDAGVETENTCPTTIPAECPRVVPSYQATIAPIIMERCLPCHTPGGIASDRLIGDYSVLYGLRADVLTHVYNCTMPPPDGGQPPVPISERDEILTWLVCNAPNN